MTISCRISGIAVCALMALAPPAIAESYKCSIGAKYTRGWIMPGYLIDYTPGSKTVAVQTFDEDGNEFSKLSGTLKVATAKKLVGNFIWKKAPVRQGGHVRVRYRAALNKSNMKFSVTAIVGNQGQTERGQGACKRVN